MYKRLLTKHPRLDESLYALKHIWGNQINLVHAVRSTELVAMRTNVAMRVDREARQAPHDVDVVRQPLWTSKPNMLHIGCSRCSMPEA